MEESADQRPRRGKNLIFFIIMILIIFSVFEWSGRIFVSWRDYKNKKLGEKSDFNFQLGTMLVVNPDMGHFFRTDSPQVLRSKESSSSYFFIDLGLEPLLFRDDGINKDRRKRLLALGDSFVWGWGVDLKDAFSEVLERLDPDLDVINAGMPGYTPRQYTDLLRKFTDSKIELQGVIYNFYSGNDVIYEYSYREWKKFIRQFPDLASPIYMPANLISQKSVDLEIETRMARLAEQESWSDFPNYFLENWLFSYSFIRRIGRLLAGGIDSAAVVKLWRNAAPVNSTDGWYTFPADPVVKSPAGDWVSLYTEIINSLAGETLSQDKRDFKAMYQFNFPLAIESIAEAKGICDSLGLQFWLVYVPAREEIVADELCQKLDEPLRSQVRAKLNTTHDDILRACRSLGIEVIDLTGECLRAERDGRKPYYQFDDHFNKNGHKLWAEIVLKNIRKAWGDDKG